MPIGPQFFVCMRPTNITSHCKSLMAMPALSSMPTAGLDVASKCCQHIRNTFRYC